MGTKETNQPTRRGTLTRKWGRWTEKYDEASASKVKIDTVYLSIIYSWEPPHAIPNSLLIALKAGFPHQFLRLFMDTSLPSSLKQQMLFRPLSWLLRRLRLFWWSPSFLRSPHKWTSWMQIFVPRSAWRGTQTKVKSLKFYAHFCLIWWIWGAFINFSKGSRTPKKSRINT